MESRKSRLCQLKESVLLLPLSVLICVREWRFALQSSPFVTNRAFLRTEFWRWVLFPGRIAWRLSADFYAGLTVTDIHCFGETPLVTLARIQRRVGICADTEVLEVGAATGRNCFWLATVMGCRVIGLEQIPSFVSRAEKVSRQSGCSDQVRFVCGDMGEALPGEPDVIYLYGSNLEDDLIRRFACRCREKGVGVTVITVSYPLTDYLPGAFDLVDSFPASFTWGVTTVYVQKVVRAGCPDNTVVI